MPTNRLQVSFLRSPGSHDEDVAVITMHWQSAAGALLNDTEMQGVEAAFGTFWASYGTHVPVFITPEQFRWYDQQVLPTLSPLVRVTSAALAPGSGALGPQAPQCSMSVTLQTDRRARWGRFYLPGPTQGDMGPEGRYLPTFVDTTATAAYTFFATCISSVGAVPVVWSAKGGQGPPAFAAGDTSRVISIRCDDVVDIVRRRRWQDSPYHAVHPF